MVVCLFLLMVFIQTFSVRLEEIGGSAAKEYSLEKALTKMKEDWKDLRFELTPYRDSVSRISESFI